MATVPSTCCPSEEQLEAIARDEPVDEVNRRHAESCEACRTAVREIRENNTFLATFVPVVKEVTRREPGPLPAPDTIPGYRIRSEIHRGGQGVVYEAVQESTRRTVAIKVLREGPFAGARDRARFQREVHILAQLDHPNIVTIHDSGTVAGSFYLVMNRIDGQPLDQYLPDNCSRVRDALDLFAMICEAVSAAHLHGVIHRDLKPNNILVEGDGKPHVLDFGLAKMTVPGEPGDSGVQTVTVPGHFMGSLPWASPEQAEGDPTRIDLRTDVYSLGVILYHMLTGRFPYDVVGKMRDVLDNILTAEPTSPSAIRAEINDEVETIILKCLAKQPERRYQSAGELARDVRRYLAGEPIDAKRDSAWYVLTKAARRYKTPLGIAVALAVLVVVFAVAMTWQARRTAWQRDIAQRERARADENSAAKAIALRESNIERGRMLCLAGNTSLAEELIWAEHLAGVQESSGTASAATDERSAWAHAHWALWELHSQQPCLRTVDPGHHGGVRQSALSPNGDILATAGLDGKVKLWELPALAERRTLDGQVGDVGDLRFSPDGRALACAGGDGTVRL